MPKFYNKQEDEGIADEEGQSQILSGPKRGSDGMRTQTHMTGFTQNSGMNTNKASIKYSDDASPLNTNQIGSK